MVNEMTVEESFLTNSIMHLYFPMLGISYVLSKKLSLIYFRCTMHNEDPRKFLIPLENTEVIKSLALFMLYVLYVLCLVYIGKIREFTLCVATLISLCLHRMLYKLNKTEIDVITERNCLSIGYGQALSYFDNYLKSTLQELEWDFQTRIGMFESRQETEVLSKLIILIPHSCKLKTYLDDYHNKYISRCQELNPIDKNVAGIPKSRYNITVYHIKNNNLSVRCAIEYAQPLKALWYMKEKNILSEQEMHEQRRVFTKSFKQMLLANPDCNKYVELIEFNDLECDTELHNILINHSAITPHLKPFPPCCEL